MTDSWRDLGEVNGWSDVYPEAYRACRAAKHPIRESTGTWRCYTTYFCDICRLRWSVDSSD